MKRKRVPAALLAELSEYSSLIRALHANAYLDVTAHIDRRHFEHDRTDSTSDDDIPPPASPARTACLSLSDQEPSPVFHSSSLQKQVLGSISKSCPKSPTPSSRRRKTDAWTRWPLLLKDVPIPEWPLEDELRKIAERALRSHSITLHSNAAAGLPENVPGTNDADEESCADDLDEDTNLSDYPDELEGISSFFPHLTSSAENYLSSIFSLIAAHTPNRSYGQQSRIEPIGWEALLDIVSSSPDPNIADPKIINAVKDRLQALYSSPKSAKDESAVVGRAIHRMECGRAAKEKFKAQLMESMESVFELPELTPVALLGGRMTRSRARRETAARLKLETEAQARIEEAEGDG